MFKTLVSSDQTILAAMRNNDPTGWELLVTQYDPLIKSITRWPKWNFSDEERQDVSQDIHLHLQAALTKFREQSTLSWFIKRIAIRQCVNEIRRQKRWRTFMTPAVQQTNNGSWNEMEFVNPVEHDPYDDAVQHERQQILYAALQHLGSTCRDSIKMFYLQHLSYRDISERLGISVNTVGSRLSKCLNKLQRDLKKQPQFEGMPE